MHALLAWSKPNSRRLFYGGDAESIGRDLRRMVPLGCGWPNPPIVGWAAAFLASEAGVGTSAVPR